MTRDRPAVDPNLPALREPDALEVESPERFEAPPRQRLFLFLVGVRLTGWLAAWLALGLGTLGVARVLRHQPTTLDGLWKVAWTGARPPAASLRELPEAAGPRHKAARELVREGLMVGRGEEVYRRLLQRTPDHEDLNLELGELLLERRDYREAATYLDRAVRVDPENGFALARLAEAQIRLGQRDEGLANRRRARDLGVDVRRVDRHLFRLFQREGQYGQAVEFGKKADPEGADVELQHELARTFYEKGRPRHNPLKPSTWRTFWSEPDRQAAQRHVERCLQLDDAHRGCLELRRKILE